MIESTSNAASIRPSARGPAKTKHHVGGKDLQGTFVKSGQHTEHDRFKPREDTSGPKTDARVVCFLDRVTSDGFVEGWARDETHFRPCFLQILQSGKVIAETIADGYRKDLLDAGLGHGHYAFSARIHDAVPGESDLAVFEKQLGIEIPVGSLKKHVIPPMENHRPWKVRDILRQTRWTAKDLFGRIECLCLSENLRAMGAMRFSDVTHMFLLNRWMGTDGHRFIERLDSGELSPEQFFRQLALSDEGLGQSAFLPGPFDGRFPYKISEIWMKIP